MEIRILKNGTEPKRTHYPKFSSSVFSFTNKNVEIIFRILQGLVQLEVCIFNEIIVNFEAFLISEFHCISHGSSLHICEEKTTKAETVSFLAHLAFNNQWK